MASTKTLLRLLSFFVVLMSLLQGGLAHASVTTGTIKGTTVDTGGLPIPGVLITLQSTALMGDLQRETDAEGRFFFPELNPGTYQVVCDKAGFTKVTKTNIVVSIGRTAILTVEMPLEQAGEEMIVEEEGTKVDTETAQRSTVLTKEFLQRIPTGRTYQTAVQLAAGVTGGGNPNIGGAGSSENTYLLDGVNITDPVTGTFSLNFNFDAIENIEVITSAYDPEYGVNLGGAINITTDDGSNTLEFRATAYYTNANWAPKLDARYAPDGLEISPNDFDSNFVLYDIGARVAGPVVRDKAWFIISYSLQRSLISATGIELPRDYEGHYIYSKLTYQPSSAHRFRVLLQTDPTTVDNINQSSRYATPESQPRQAQGGVVASLQWDWFISPEMFLESKNTFQKSFLEISQVPCTHNEELGYNPCDSTELENSIDLTTPGRYGEYGAYDTVNFPYYQFDDRYRLGTQNKFSLLQLDALGTHDLKIGFEVERTAWHWIVGYPGNVYYVDLNQVTYDPETLENYFWVESSGTFGFTSFSDHWGGFIQDVYKPIDNLTFRYGIRLDKTGFFDDLGNKRLGDYLWGPRFSVIWDPWGNGKTKFTGSAGRFNDTGRQEISNYLFQSGFGYKLILGEYFGNFTSEATSDYQYVPNENTNTVGEDIIAPHSDEFTVGAEREVWRNIIAGITFIGKYTRNLYAFDELNYVYDENGYNTIGTYDGTTNTLYRLRTPSIARRDYFRTDIYANHQLADRWVMQFDYSYSSSRGSVQDTPSAFLANPAQIPYYLNGYLYTDIRHDVSGGVAWDLPNDPWTTQVGTVLFMESGNPVSRYYEDSLNSSILKDTAGAYAREEGFVQLSVLVSQAIPVRKGELKAHVEMQNVLSQHQGTIAYIVDNRWVIYDRQNPLGITLGASYEF